jgi:hypothetical protein
MRDVHQRSLRSVLVAGVIVCVFGLVLGSVPGASAGPLAAPPRAFETPTPGPDGKIIYIIKTGDDLWTIAALSGKSVEELMALNGIQPGDYITPGMQLILGLAGPALPTAEPVQRATATVRQVTPTPVFGTGEICVLLFLDVNGNARLDQGEESLAGGQVSIAEPSGSIAGETTTTADPESYCFQGMQNGDYNVSAAAPQDYNPTTAMNVPIRLTPGEVKYIEFGAQASAAIGGGGSGGGNRSTALGILGVVMLAAAVALGVYAARYSRKPNGTLR